ncbi:MAG: GntR family transcriptional regulator [Chitinophagaceae bacterium]|nr:GntR family transcriptional regulator [Chitinophagaceae bacterium]
MEFNSQQPIYLQIAEMICERIVLKQFREDERILSVREMAVQLEVNPNTVMRTFEFLQGKEIINNKRGVGYFVAADGISKAGDLLKTEFVQVKLPQFFKTARLLAISPEELQELYAKFINNTDVQK